MSEDSNSEAILRNFDPRRISDHVTKFIPVQILQDGVEVSCILMPENVITGNKEQDGKLALEQYNIFAWADSVINREKLRDPQMIEMFINGLTEVTTYYIAANVLCVLFERLQNESDVDSLTFTDVESDVENIDSDDDIPDGLFWKIQEPLFTRLKPIIETQVRIESEKAALYIWKYIFAETRREIDAEFTLEEILSMSDKEFDELFYNRLYQKDRFADPLSFYSQDLARIALDAISPTTLTLDQLSRLLKVEIHKEKNSNKHSASTLQITGELNYEPSPYEWKKIYSGLLQAIPIGNEIPKTFTYLINGETTVINIKTESSELHFIHKSSELGHKLKKIIEGDFRERRHSDEEFIETAYQIGKANKTLTKEYLCELVGCSTSTLDNHEDDNRQLWKSCKEEYQKGKLEWLSKTLNSPGKS